MIAGIFLYFASLRHLSNSLRRSEMSWDVYRTWDGCYCCSPYPPEIGESLTLHLSGMTADEAIAYCDSQNHPRS